MVALATQFEYMGVWKHMILSMPALGAAWRCSIPIYFAFFQKRHAVDDRDKICKVTNEEKQQYHFLIKPYISCSIIL